MRKVHILSGEELVAKGATKQDTTLPEVGLKDVIPNGSWLEQKQIQAAVEARKHLVEVPRIEKYGILSRGEWVEELGLVKVTSHVGGHWKYVGHVRNNQLYLKPEEALYLMETNAFQLKYDEVTVPLQQAYSLLLGGKVTLFQYKVYASLSRLGYKILRHGELDVHSDDEDAPVSEYERKMNLCSLKKAKKKYSFERNVASSKSDIKANNTETKTANNGNICSETKDKVEIIDNQSVDELNNDGKDASHDEQFGENTVNSSSKPFQGNNTENKTANNEEICNETKDKVEIIDSQSIDEFSNDCKDASNDEKFGENTVNSSSKPFQGNNTENKTANNEKICNETKDNNQSIDELSNDGKDVSNDNQFGEKSVNSSSKPFKDNKDLNSGDILRPEEQEEDDKENSKTSNETIVKMAPKTSNNETPLESNERKSEGPDIKEIQANAETMITKKDAKLRSMLKRKLKTLSRKKIDKYFENVPEMCQKSVVTLKVPEEIYLPRNVFLNNTTYVIDLQKIRKKAVGPQDNPRTYSLSDEVNAAHVGRIRSSNRNETLHNNSWTPQFTPNNGIPRFQQWYPFGLRHRHVNTNFLINLTFQRPFMPQHMGFPPRFHFFHRHQMPFFARPPRIINWENQNETTSENRASNNERENRKRSSTSHRTVHLEAIKGLAIKLKELIRNGTMHQQNVASLESLINTYNVRYRAKLRLDSSLNLIDEEMVVDTIELDDDEPESKRPRETSTTYEENLQAIKQLAQRLKELEAKGKASSRHRRVFSNMVNNFNKSYKSEIYYDNNYEIIDRRQIVLDSSDSDCILDEAVEINKSDGKKFINPFSVFKHFSVEPSTSKEIPSKYSEISTVFNKNWLPKEDDFGKPEVVSKKAGHQYLMDTITKEYLFEFMKNYQTDYKNWLDIKLSFWESIDDTPVEIPQEENVNTDLSTNSLVKPEDCKDMASVLQKLRIIKTCEEVKSETALSIDFDVWSRDVPQFRKSDKPTPHFRILCIDEKNGLPSGADIQTLYSQCEDEVPIVFAVVGLGSISYLQMKPTDLPVYIPSSDSGLTRVFVG